MTDHRERLARLRKVALSEFGHDHPALRLAADAMSGCDDALTRAACAALSELLGASRDRCAVVLREAGTVADMSAGRADAATLTMIAAARHLEQHGFLAPGSAVAVMIDNGPSQPERLVGIGGTWQGCRIAAVPAVASHG